jgi:hypothetical protein
MVYVSKLISQIYSSNEPLHVSDSSSVHHLEFFTVHIAMVYVSKIILLYLFTMSISKVFRKQSRYNTDEALIIVYVRICSVG